MSANALCYGVDRVAKEPRGRRERSAITGSLLLSLLREDLDGFGPSARSDRASFQISLLLHVMLYTGFFHVSNIEPSQSFSMTKVGALTGICSIRTVKTTTPSTTRNAPMHASAAFHYTRDRTSVRSRCRLLTALMGRRRAGRAPRGRADGQDRHGVACRLRATSTP